MTPQLLALRAQALVQGRRRALLGITGGPGSGKTTFAENLVALLRSMPPEGRPAESWVAYLPMDGYHLADVELDRLGRRGRKGAPDTFDAKGYAALLRRIRADEDEVVYAPAFERELEQPVAGAIAVPRAARLVVTEGNYLLLDTDGWAAVRPELDEVWFCEVEASERVRRLVERHERFGKDHDAAVAWVRDVDQQNADLVGATAVRADLLLPQSVLELTPSAPVNAGR